MMIAGRYECPSCGNVLHILQNETKVREPSRCGCGRKGKFKLLDGAVDQLESTERDDLRAELDARFALMAGEVKRLFAVLEKALKLSKAEA